MSGIAKRNLLILIFLFIAVFAADAWGNPIANAPFDWTATEAGALRLKVKINNQELNNNITISSKPELNVEVYDDNGIKSVRAFIDGIEMKNNSLTAQNIEGLVVASFTSDVELAAGIHTLIVEAEDNLGTKGTISAFGLKVYSDLEVLGKPMNYPNPFKPSVEKTNINYKLSKDAEIKLMIYDLAGRQVYSQLFASGTPNGGQAGENEPTWEGRDSAGNLVGNGVYVYFITSGGKVLGSGEMAIYE